MKKNFTFELNLFKHFTLAKLLGGLFTALFIATLKYYISGGFHIEYREFWTNLGLGIGGWTFNMGVITLLTEYLDTKDINFNLKQFIFGFDTMNSSPEPGFEKFKPKLYNAMDLSDNSNLNKGLDNHKGVGKESQVNYGESSAITSQRVERLNDNLPLDKGKNKVKVTLDYVEARESYRAAWSRAFPGLDPTSVFFPSLTNPGPGFNVPGGEVPVRDEICKNIDYNSHILSQFKNMDLETALEQRNNNIMFIKVLETKLDFAQKAFSKLPLIPTTEYEFKLKNQILRDLDILSKDKVRAESRATLLSSRIEYIDGKINKK